MNGSLKMGRQPVRLGGGRVGSGMGRNRARWYVRGLVGIGGHLVREGLLGVSGVLRRVRRARDNAGSLLLRFGLIRKVEVLERRELEIV